MTDKKAKVAFVKTRNRKYGVKKAVQLLGINPLRGKKVLIKPNFNTADPPPASTHMETLEAIMEISKEMGATKISIGERCGFAGMIRTEDVFRKKGVYDLARKFSAEVINFETLGPEGWVKFNPPSSHWLTGFKFARPMVEADAVVITPCLKTHRFGGVFTMSLKLAVGAVKPSYMPELHASPLSIRKMIAEINVAYHPALIVLDGVDAFTDGGPERGTLKRGNVILAGTDRIAVDAVGLAVLKYLGSNSKIMNTPIFEQDQIKRAVELNLGVKSPEEIEIIAADEESREYASQIRSILLSG